MPLIKLENICKTYKDAQIIKNLSLEIADNEFTVFIGPSGCGKSTLLRMISGLDFPTSGDIYFGEKKVTNFPPDKRNLSMVFQDYALYPHMNVYDNIAFGLIIAKTPKAIIQEKIAVVAKMIGLEGLLERKPSELSGGQRQRVAMGRALIRDTGLLLMDEPLSNLDAKLRTHMRSELTLLKQKIQKNIIYVTHDQVEAMTLADKIVVLNEGIVQQYDVPKVLYDKPDNRFVAEFLGNPKMNIIIAQLHTINHVLYAKGNGFDIMLSKQQADALENYPERKVLLGIRPHDLKLTSYKNDDNYFDCRLKFKEYIGANCIITANCAAKTLQFDLPSDELSFLDDEKLILTCDRDKLHFFDIHTEKNLLKE